MTENDTQPPCLADDSKTSGNSPEGDDHSEELIKLVLHEIRNPLSVAMGRLNLAKQECTTEHLDSVEQSLDRIDSLIENFGTITVGGDAIEETQPIELRTVVKDSWEVVESPEASMSVDASCMVEADPLRLKQVLENLFRNAVENSGGGVTITVGELPDCSGFYVSDDGPGIPPDTREVVFERGYTTRPNGTGFGLWIVERFVTAHGWDITVTESSTDGTRFEIRTQPA